MMASMLHTVRALNYPDYRIFLAGQGAALIGTWCQRIALIWLVYSTTGSPLLLGLVTFMAEIPFLVISPIGGVIADRLNQKKALIAIEAVASLQAFLLAALVWAGTATIELILLITLVQGICQALDMPLRQSLFPKLIDRPQDLPNAIALMAFMNNAGRLIGPVIAGLLIAAFGEELCFVLSGTGYLLVIVALSRITIASHPVKSETGPVFRQLRTGLIYSWSQPSIRANLSILGAIGFCYLPYLILVPVFTREVLGGNAQSLGYLLSSAGLGALLGLAWIARQTKIDTFPRLIVASSTTGALGMLILSQITTEIMAVFAIAMIGIGISVSATAINIYLQLVAATEKRGRVLGLYSTAFFGIAPLGNFTAGAIMESVGSATTIFVLGLLGLVCTILFSLSTRDFRGQA